MLSRIIGIGLAGAAGALTRYWLAGWVQQLVDTRFPIGTATVNILGSFLFGVVWSMAEERFSISSEARIIILSGFMGSFTTFSTLIFETGTLMQDSRWMLAAGNVVLQVILGLVCLFLGLSVGRMV